jgi:hypothetical protein
MPRAVYKVKYSIRKVVYTKSIIGFNSDFHGSLAEAEGLGVIRLVSGTLDEWSLLVTSD